MTRSPHEHPEVATIDASERLQRVLSARGVESRRKAEDLIRAGRVTVDGETVTELGTKVDPRRARITVDGQVLRPQRLRYILLNKPIGFITTTDDERGRRTVMDLVNVPERVYPVGRLDRDTEGLLLLTNDGDVANRVMHPRYGLAKEYNVLTDRRPIDPVLERVRRGTTIDGKTVVPEEFRILRETRDGPLLTITIHEGTKHLVRRIMEQAGIRVVRLRRVRLGPLSISGIREGTYRELSPGELTSLFEALHIHAADERAIAPTGVKTGPPIRLRDASRPKPERSTAVPRQGGTNPASESGQPRPRPAASSRRRGDAPENDPPRRHDANDEAATTQQPRDPRNDRRRGKQSNQRPASGPGREADERSTPGERTAGKKADKSTNRPPSPTKGAVRGRGRRIDGNQPPPSKKTSRHRSKSSQPRRPAPPPSPAREDDDRS